MDFDIVSDLQEGTVDTGVQGDSTSAPVAPPATQAQPLKVDTQEAPKAEAPVSLRDQISSAIKGTREEGNDLPRNPDGTFAPKAKEADPSLAASDATAQQPAGTQPATASQAAVPAGIDPAVFNALPAETQAGLARTMEALNERQVRLSNFEQMEQLIAPRRQAWALGGMTETQAINQLLALSDFATNDPSGFIKYFAQHNGVDLEEVVFGSDPGDPEVTALKQQVQQLQGQLNGFNTQAQQASLQRTTEEIFTFFGEKDAQGNLLRPYAEELGEQLLPFIEQALQHNPNLPRSQILQDAYDRACWGTPGTRAKMQQAAQVAQQAEAMRQQQEKVKAASAAGVSVAPGVPTTPAPNPADAGLSLRDTIKASIAASQ